MNIEGDSSVIPPNECVRKRPACTILWAQLLPTEPSFWGTLLLKLCIIWRLWKPTTSCGAPLERGQASSPHGETRPPAGCTERYHLARQRGLSERGKPSYTSHASHPLTRASARLHGTAAREEGPLSGEGQVDDL